jgi:anaerobic ribonucleoside-triphosphate reductase
MYNESAKLFGETLKNAVKTKNVADAYTAYGGVRDLMKIINNMASNVSVKGGRGHQAATKLNSFYNKADEINKVADILDAAGAKQKAKALKDFTNALSDYGSGMSGDAVEEASRIKELNAVFNSAQKLAKGGLASRR